MIRSHYFTIYQTAVRILESTGRTRKTDEIQTKYTQKQPKALNQQKGVKSFDWTQFFKTADLDLVAKMGCCEHKKAHAIHNMPDLKLQSGSSNKKYSLTTTNVSLNPSTQVVPPRGQHRQDQRPKQEAPSKPKEIIKNPVQQGIQLNTIVNEMNLDSDEYEEKKSEIADELVDKYDKGQKGYLDQYEFVSLVKKHSSKNITEDEAKNMMSYDPSEGKKIVDKLDLFQLIQRPRK